MTLSGARLGTLPPEVSSRLTEIVSGGVTGRGPSVLCTDAIWQGALNLLSGRERVAIVSGFYVPSASAPETDGPTGSVVLARALLRLGYDAAIWTDAHCLGSMQACAEALLFPTARVLDVSGTDDVPVPPDILIYIERLGRARDGAYYNMRGQDISEWTAPLDRYALEWDVPVIGIGDGGNEVGMGSYAAELPGLMPDYAPCLCAVPASLCIPVDVSNWGAYALVSALSYIRGEWLGQTREEEIAMLQALCRCGVVDGVTRRCEMSVDGMGTDVQLEVLSSLTELAAPRNTNRDSL